MAKPDADGPYHSSSKCKGHSRAPMRSPSSAIEIFVAAGAEKTDGRRCRRATDMRESETLHQCLDLRSRNRLVWVTAHPVVDVVLELHAAQALIILDIGLEIIAGQARSEEHTS